MTPIGIGFSLSCVEFGAWYLEFIPEGANPGWERIGG